ncbi:HNH endonuclease family protein [Sciscionella marina]|uniref:HNH endonuclease family protein n=1 Tax=Sciscionella marina TaxID=508770 RepID=UPI0003712B8B|nr:HNH endonuclease family protein [Sciscionella marina]
MTKLRLRTATISLTAAAGISLFGLAVPASATPPGIPDAGTARGYLGTLTVAADGSMDGYSREKFPHWIAQEGNCNTREDVLKRDGENVKVGSDCYPTSGTWTSAYDGQKESKASEVQIDHIVPLADAWRTGAAKWSQDQRQAFANDLKDPQLIAVSGSSNEEKSDKTPDEWMPSDAGYRCDYAASFVAIKHQYKLTVKPEEKKSLEDTLGKC